MKKPPSYYKEDFEKHFGKLNVGQIWAIVKFSKYVRLRCRNNSAFNNFISQVFPHADFKQVTKKRSDGWMYPSLSISIEHTTIEESGEDEEV